MENKKNKSIFIFYVYNFLINARFSRGVLLLYCLEIGLSLAEFGTVQSVYFLVKMLAEIPTGILADRFSKKKILGLGALISSVSSFFLFLAPNFFISPNFCVILLLFSLDSFSLVKLFKYSAKSPFQFFIIFSENIFKLFIVFIFFIS